MGNWCGKPSSVAAHDSTSVTVRRSKDSLATSSVADTTSVSSSNSSYDSSSSYAYGNTSTTNTTTSTTSGSVLKAFIDPFPEANGNPSLLFGSIDMPSLESPLQIAPRRSSRRAFSVVNPSLSWSDASLNAPVEINDPPAFMMATGSSVELSPRRRFSAVSLDGTESIGGLQTPTPPNEAPTGASTTASTVSAPDSRGGRRTPRRLELEDSLDFSLMEKAPRSMAPMPVRTVAAVA